ncbi:uncharacterized protein SPPG_01869 [Spizellomyces punctatus DAOM BR117]|uniref:EH domain-containing protein n=1 Tax=Spizellomyces punctatus (strain DAOM BR117) TaxID=645134 RepID=A0A0L0HP06_SPIPD|nr:uncharacterized protein SPPG_01869 [Spizellomyces punctatus DAOM BR117]KND02788.1 hypothetical protein SPPG_01869 [Spizellomyces punctatus DAOM BR117]|eukprot:XP_016610827.1 hypothetical protein SPPG_01869 [Spizellomyces punctatus DAOM BR117]
MSQDFDWYISPADRFAAETQFAKYSGDEDEVALNQLEPLFQLSRLSVEEFSQIWLRFYRQLIDIRMAQKINKEQFVYFAHVLNTRRKGKPLPIGIPLDMKEAFLKEPKESSRPYVRNTTDNIRDLGVNRNKSAKELEEELEQVEADIRSARGESSLAAERLEELKQAKDESVHLADYKRRQLAGLREEVSQLRSSLQAPGSASSGGGGQRMEELLSKLAAEKQLLENRRAEVQRSLNTL